MSENFISANGLSPRGVIFTLFKASVIIALFYLTDVNYPLFWGIMTTLVLIWLTIGAIPGAGKRGQRLLKRGKAAEAIEYYLRTYRFYTRHPWLDNLRHVLFFDISKYGYREKALINLGACYLSKGDSDKAETVYRDGAQEFPHNPTLLSNLKMMEAMKEYAESCPIR